MVVKFPKRAYGPCCLLNPNSNGVYILVEVSYCIRTYSLSLRKKL